MKRFKNIVNENQDDSFSDNEKYNLAYLRLKKIKRFYVHLAVYVLVNSFLIANTFYKNEYNLGAFLRWETFATAFFWGIGLVFHGFSVFGRDFIFNKEWEERKIQEIMNKEANKYE